MSIQKIMIPIMILIIMKRRIAMMRTTLNKIEPTVMTPRRNKELLRIDRRNVLIKAILTRKNSIRKGMVNRRYFQFNNFFLDFFYKIL